MRHPVFNLFTHHGCVESEPGEVECDLDAVVVADGVDGLELEGLAEGGPLREQVVPHATGGLQSALLRVKRKAVHVSL